MNVVIDGRTADIHLYLSRLNWNEFLLASGQGIKNPHASLLIDSPYIFADSSGMSISPATVECGIAFSSGGGKEIGLP